MRSGWPGEPEQLDQNRHRTWLQMSLDHKDTRPACAVQVRFLPAQQHSANTLAESKSKRVCSTWHSYPRNAPLPQPHKGLKQLNLLFVTKGFIFSSYECQQEVAPTYWSTWDPPVRSWAAGKDLGNGKKQPSLENPAHLNLFKPREEREVTRTHTHITDQGVNGMGSWDWDKLKIKVNHIQKK